MYLKILSILAVVSESAGAITQLVFPNNKGVSGVLAYIIKVVQSLQSIDPPQS